ncbi:protein-export chaperone SecB [Parvibaculum sp.]|mgnify:CR=1 FL=1|jgi:preprotein translocase subunit SecB|uniref:protein-export chaperone SecB n=1 Tax=Parvibaculum sp. TaxID=2024848 RepID=UPI000C3A124F|nr:protein-export chaperone SecB [Parvibaculum sp.]MAM95887.1 protein-export chaperone SecB [Parvibaculum sp.]HCX66865.1 protein-export chaperone SecB [Rhodobiaceae bacterium]|tara:strand:+ start:42492 stop:42998 length:507 start_codon:yes stop_codon:yes gene_type:complete
MSDQGSINTGNAGNGGEPPTAQLRVLTQYVKDISFENPNAPQMFGPLEEQPQIGLRVDVGVKRMNDNDYEVTLKISADAKVKDKPMFLVELEYAGLFRLTNIPEKDLEAVLVVECPRQIFPFARRVLADVTRDGGYPPLMIDPIDFVNLYQQRREQMAQEVAETKQPN